MTSLSLTAAYLSEKGEKTLIFPMWTNTWESKQIVSGREKGKVPTLACNHLALGEISFIILWMGTYGSRSNTLVMWGALWVWRRRNVLWCANFVWRQTVPKCENIHGALFSWHSIVWILYLTYPSSCWWTFGLCLIMKLQEFFMYSGYKLLSGIFVANIFFQFMKPFNF